MSNKPSHLTKNEKRELRKLAGIAYERELAAALKAMREKFDKWEKGAITVFELNDHIHEFHNGISRQLWGFYTAGHNETAVRMAIDNGIISGTELSPGLLEKLRGGISCPKERK